MSKIKELEEILKEGVLPEVQETIEDLEELIEENKNDSETKDELKYMQDVKAYFDEAISNIDNGSMTEEIASALLNDLEKMKADDENQ